MQQYRDIKARHPQTILFFRMGDFYEMFEDDAKLAARELGLTLTSRNNGGAAEVPPAGDTAAALARYEARELVVPAEVSVSADVGTVTVREAWEFDPELAREDLMRTYGIASLDGLGVSAEDRPAIGAAGALLRYARELKPGGLPHLAHPTIVRRGDVLPLDEMTRRNLELVEPLRAGAEGAPLLEVIDGTLTPMGGRPLRRSLLAPLVDPAAINARLDAVQVLVGDSRGR